MNYLMPLYIQCIQILPRIKLTSLGRALNSAPMCRGQYCQGQVLCYPFPSGTLCRNQITRAATRRTFVKSTIPVFASAVYAPCFVQPTTHSGRFPRSWWYCISALESGGQLLPCACLVISMQPHAWFFNWCLFAITVIISHIEVFQKSLKSEN